MSRSRSDREEFCAAYGFSPNWLNLEISKLGDDVCSQTSHPSGEGVVAKGEGADIVLPNTHVQWTHNGSVILTGRSHHIPSNSL